MCTVAQRWRTVRGDIGIVPVASLLVPGDLRSRIGKWPHLHKGSLSTFVLVDGFQFVAPPVPIATSAQCSMHASRRKEPFLVAVHGLMCVFRRRIMTGLDAPAANPAGIRGRLTYTVDCSVSPNAHSSSHMHTAAAHHDSSHASGMEGCATYFLIGAQLSDARWDECPK